MHVHATAARTRFALLLVVLSLVLSACVLPGAGDSAAESSASDRVDDDAEQALADTPDNTTTEDERTSDGPTTEDDDTPPDFSPDPGPGIVRTVESRRSVELPGGKVLIGEMRHLDIPARDSYWLDYTVTFEPDFFYTKTGKLPGLAGGNATTGCDRKDPAGWSARLGWTLDGKGKLYVYDQDRSNQCGTNQYFADDKRYEAGETHRLTQWIKLNTPGEDDGVIQVWLDGELAVTASDLELRGEVDDSRALIDTLAYSVFSGGKDPDIFAPPSDQSIEFGPISIATCRPDFDVAETRCEARS